MFLSALPEVCADYPGFGPAQLSFGSLYFYCIVQGDFINWASPENVSRLAPPKFAWSGPPLDFLSV